MVVVLIITSTTVPGIVCYYYLVVAMVDCGQLCLVFTFIFFYIPLKHSDGNLVQPTALHEFNDSDSPIQSVAIDDSGRLGTWCLIHVNA